MSRTNENKLKMKDIATIGIFSALLFVVTMVAGALMGISMVLNMYSVAVVAVLSAPLYMLIMAKVHKKGAVLLTFAIVGILWGLFGGIFVLIWMLGFGVVGEVLASKSKYQNYKMLTVSFGLYSVGYYLGAIAPLYYYPVFWYGFDRPKETVDTAYFEENGGYDFARDFFEEAYRMAVKEAGDERYVLSAVLHADERNRGLSKALRYDVFHYHLHVVYIPVVEKEILWSKRCKDEALRGMVREIIHQVSRSKKWAYPEAVDEQGKPILGKNGKPIRIPSYSLLQDRFYEHMRLAGFDGFERGELGSTRVNLNSLDFKIQEDKKRLMQLEKLVAAKEMKLEQVSEKLVAQKQVNKQYHDLDGIGKKTVFGKIELTEKDYTDVISLAREGILSRVKISELTQKLQDAGARILDLQSSWERLYEQTKDFRQAVKLAPQRVKEVFTEIFAKDRETRELQRILRRSVKKRNEYER